MQKDSNASMPQAQEETPAPTSGLSAASSDGKDVLPPKPVPKKRPVRPAHSQIESGVEFVHEVIQVDPAPEAPRQESPIPEYEVQLATPRAPGDLIASLLSTDADDKAFSGSDQTEMGPPQGKKTKPAARTKFGRSIAGSMRKKAGPKTVLTKSKRRKTKPDEQEHSRTPQQEEYANYNIPPHLLDHSRRPSGVSIWFIPDEGHQCLICSTLRRRFRLVCIYACLAASLTSIFQECTVLIGYTVSCHHAQVFLPDRGVHGTSLPVSCHFTAAGKTSAECSAECSID